MRRGSPTLSRKPHKIFCIIGHGWYKSSCIGIEYNIIIYNEAMRRRRRRRLFIVLVVIV
jgi:hypothetical protein